MHLVRLGILLNCSSVIVVGPELRSLNTFRSSSVSELLILQIKELELTNTKETWGKVTAAQRVRK